ncbi:hypothetical protein [Sodalis glossinidius]|uniref:hypothetical protein n=1 Tax=Sodalis glossinidius TaxID=63612 RepID=UPI0011D17B18|nr:hypothetical protein [Sodalis glossinidius]
MFDKKNGSIIFSGRAQTFTYWYNNSHKGRTFIAIMKDVEECHDLDRCLIGVKHQLGEPDEILTHKDMTFYIYNNGISIK